MLLKRKLSYQMWKSVNFRTLITPTGNGADVDVPLESIRVFSSMDGLDALLEDDPWNLDVNLSKRDVGGGGGGGVKEKQHGSTNVIVVSSAGGEPSTTAPIGVNAPINSGNRKGMEEGNIGTRSTSIGTTASNTNSVMINITDSLTTYLNNTGPLLSGPTSYAKLFTSEPSRKSVNFRTLITSAGNRADVVVSLESIRAISEHVANTAYDFFLRKRVAYPVVANCVWNTWSKYELVKSMVNSADVVVSLESIRAISEHVANTAYDFFLRKRNPDVNLLKKDVGTVPVWVKLHGVLMTAFNNDELSVIATKLVMVAYVILISSDSFEESVGLSTSQGILFGMIPNVIPAVVSTSVPIIPDMAAAVVAPPAGVVDLDIHATLETDTFEDPSSPVHALAAPITSSFLCSDPYESFGDFSNSDSPDSLSPLDSHKTVVAQ
nr:hypothetical protein [Tanacetum cinerariifolium]